MMTMSGVISISGGAGTMSSATGAVMVMMFITIIIIGFQPGNDLFRRLS